MTTDVELQESLLGEAERVFERERGKLFTDDGQRLFSDAEHERRMSALLEPLRARTEVAAAAADEDLRLVATEQAGVDGADLFAELPEAAQQQAAAQREFLAEDIRQLPLDELGRRARAIALGDDQAVAYLLWRYGRARLQSIKAEQQASGRRLEPDAAHGVLQLDEAVQAIEKRLGARLERRRVELAQRHEKAIDVKIRATTVLKQSGAVPSNAATIRSYW